MGLFSKKKKEETQEEKKEEENTEEAEDENGEKKSKSEAEPTEANITKIAVEVDRLKASAEAFSEVRKSFSERFTRTSEQIGELRAMILDRDRTIQQVELKAIKAADLVETVQPEKLMIEIQKQQAKFEALKASLEGNESIMERIMSDLKEMRSKLTFFKGIEEIMKLSEEVKKDLMEMKKVEANMGVSLDKMQTMYSEVRKKYQSIDMFNEALQELKVQAEQHTKDIDHIKAKISNVAEKEDLDKAISKVQQSVNTLQHLKKSSSLTKDISDLRNLLETLEKK